MCVPSSGSIDYNGDFARVDVFLCLAVYAPYRAYWWGLTFLNTLLGGNTLVGRVSDILTQSGTNRSRRSATVGRHIREGAIPEEKSRKNFRHGS